MLDRDEKGRARLGGVLLEDLLAAELGVTTPAYVYDLDAMVGELRALGQAFEQTPHLVAYAVKANSAGPIVQALAAAGAGADVVSLGELHLALRCGVSADNIVWSGVAKTHADIDAALGAGPRGILAIQAESVEEIPRIAARARALGRRARVSLRLNPGVLADTHAHVATGHDEAKFGIASDDIPRAMQALVASPELDLVGLTTHVGSQLTDTSAYVAAAQSLLTLAKAQQAERAPLDFLDFGGGFGIDYGDGCAVRPADFARAIVALLQQENLQPPRILVEPGRSLVASHGVLLSSVISEKRARDRGGSEVRRWLMIDAGMNDLMRPALYGARHRIEPLLRAPSPQAPLFRVVGPVCESTDDFGEHPFELPLPSHVLLRDVGAYGFTMASQYNGRALPTEVFLKGGRVAQVFPGRSVAAWVEERVTGR